jgi:K+-transporting ATPase ATPase B chain
MLFVGAVEAAPRASRRSCNTQIRSFDLAKKRTIMKKKTSLTLLDPVLLKPAVRASFAKLSPAVQWRNPVMFVVYLGSIVTTLLGLQAQKDTGFILTISAWLWFTVLFANFAESLAEGRAKAQSASLRGLKQSTLAKKLKDPVYGTAWVQAQAENLRKGDVVQVDAGDMIPLDGDVIQGVATVDESAITGESAPVVRESGGDFSSVTGGTRVLSDWLVVRITVNPGESFLDRMISMVEGAMSRMMQANVIATSGRAVEAAGDVDVLLLDKTGTITHGNRQAAAFLPAPGLTEAQLALCAMQASMADGTPEGRSVVALAQRLGLTEALSGTTQEVAFTAQTRMSGMDVIHADGSTRQLRKGAVDAIRKHVESLGGSVPAEVVRASDEVSRRGSTPLAVADGKQVLGIVELKDIVKAGIKERFGELRRMGIKTVMITGDNRLTASAIAAEAGVDDFLAEATPEDKLKLIRQYQSEGRLVAMTGDGTNDAPALAQADVAVAMNSGTQAAKEAGNMVDLDSNPTKLLEVVETGKALLMTRGSLTTFSIANDVAKYFAIIPAIFVSTYPQLGALNVMQLGSPNSAILSAVIFNALIIMFLIPLALKGVKYRPVGAAALLRRNLAIYGLGGLVVPFVGIKLIDMLMVALHLV